MFMCFYLKLEIAFPDITDWKKANGALLCFHCFCSGVLVLGLWHAKHPSPPHSSWLSAPSASSTGSLRGVDSEKGEGKVTRSCFILWLPGAGITSSALSSRKCGTDKSCPLRSQAFLICKCSVKESKQTSPSAGNY